MTDLPAPVNKAATVADTVIKTVNQVVTGAVETALQTYVPALGLPVVKQVIDYVLEDMDDKLSKFEQTGVTFLIIDGQVASERGSVADQLAAIRAAEASGNALLLQAAVAHFAAANSSLVHDDGSAIPQ